ncbi:hypothetical protein R5W24_000458 [Gemmata sp. JC717]|uniref:Rz1-like lysis system protein LysC n=1 Tax=Gemmata algarum TaxID=2975278 RepID=UPI0021BB5171|nr:hypothetical protein [Gemmata algarum]MDY3551382.1 hypothetical protein [Gemmata algarum]
MTTLSACSGTPPVPRAYQNANLVAECRAAPTFEGRTSDDLVSAYLRLSALYAECAARHNALADSVAGG